MVQTVTLEERWQALAIGALEELWISAGVTAHLVRPVHAVLHAVAASLLLQATRPVAVEEIGGCTLVVSAAEVIGAVRAPGVLRAALVGSHTRASVKALVLVLPGAARGAELLVLAIGAVELSVAPDELVHAGAVGFVAQEIVLRLVRAVARAAAAGHSRGDDLLVGTDTVGSPVGRGRSVALAQSSLYAVTATGSIAGVGSPSAPLSVHRRFVAADASIGAGVVGVDGAAVVQTVALADAVQVAGAGGERDVAASGALGAAAVGRRGRAGRVERLTRGAYRVGAQRSVTAMLFRILTCVVPVDDGRKSLVADVGGLTVQGGSLGARKCRFLAAFVARCGTARRQQSVGELAGEVVGLALIAGRLVTLEEVYG